MNLSFNTLIQQFIRMIYYHIENFLPDRHAKLIEFMDQIAQSGYKNCRVKIFEFKVVPHPLTQLRFERYPSAHSKYVVFVNRIIADNTKSFCQPNFYHIK